MWNKKMTNQQRQYLTAKLKAGGVSIHANGMIRVDDSPLVTDILEKLKSRIFEAVATDGLLDGTSRLPYDSGELILTNDLVTYSELLPDYKRMGYRTPNLVLGFYLVDKSHIQLINQEIAQGRLTPLTALTELDKVHARLALRP